MNTTLENLDVTRREVSNSINREKKSALGQFFTPSPIAEFMSSLFCLPDKEEISILDPGAGIGSLSVALIQKLSENSQYRTIHWTGYEIDDTLLHNLKAHLKNAEKSLLKNKIELHSNFINADFLIDSVRHIQSNKRPIYDFAIINPPYKKILSDSYHRKILSSVKIETVNLYTAFITLSLELLKPGGQLVAIIPRSFCNGPYYKSFRKYLITNTSFKRIHSFVSRDKAFKDDDVLQENIIIHLEKQGIQGNVEISISEDSSFNNMKELIFPFEMIVKSQDSEQFIHIPTSTKTYPRSYQTTFSYSLYDLGLSVSTGPIVDFRSSKITTSNYEKDCIPLLYPFNFGILEINWPIRGKKHNGVVYDENGKNQLFTRGFYVVTRRFSSKEENRRVYANVVNPDKFTSDYFTFENHLNVFHIYKNGLKKEIAYGLAIYLNSTYLDQQFRQFSGHTQVNVTDLKLLKYPSAYKLENIGKWAITQENITQENIDKEILNNAIQ